MFLGMTLWFSATAANAAIVAEFHLAGAIAAWLTMAVQGGFVVGTLTSAALNLPDRFSARRLFALGCAVGATANAALVVANGAVTIIVLRFVTGAALAWVYPPGMKIAAGWFERRRGAALGILVGAVTIGSAFPHLLASATAAIAWRTLILAASVLALTGGVLVLALVDDGPYAASSAPFDRAAIARVFRDRQTRRATLGYLGHMWELYAVWTWIAAFASASVGHDGAVPSSATGSIVAFAAIAGGGIGSAAAGWFADRIGPARSASWAMAVSATCCVASPLLFGAPTSVLLLFAVVWGVAAIADSAQLSTLVAHFSPRDQVGTALTVQTCAGFLLTLASIQLVPMLAPAIGWRWVFTCLVPGPIAGVAALHGLPRHLVASARVLPLQPRRQLSGRR